MSKFVGNCSHIINWQEIIAHLEDSYEPIIKKAAPEYWLEPTILEPGYNGSKVERNTDKDMCDDWVNARYCFESAIWLVYRSGQHYSRQVEDIICQHLNIDLCWSVINKIDPGYTVPIHLDPDDDPSRGGDKKVRFICQISPPSRGQVLLVADQAFTNLKVGDLYEWDHYLDQHSAANTGLIPVYYFSIEGFKRD
jgi:hypothetical protein